MKQCPKCRTTYTDESLVYCLADGTQLEDNDDDRETFVRTTASPRQPRFQDNVGQASDGPSAMKVALVVGLVLAMLVGAAVFAAALIYFNKDSRRAAANLVNADTPRPTPTQSASTPDNSNTETVKLREQIANLEKRLDEQKNAGLPNSDTVPPDQPSTAFGSPTVNSPADGFLALRTLPSSEIGDRIIKIPNGSRVSIAGCLARTRVGNKTGRWCKASYNGYSGWVFDAWLEY